MTTRNFLNWNDPSYPNPTPDLLDLVENYLLVAQILVRRGFAHSDEARAFLDPRFYTATPAAALPDCAVAVDYLVDALRNDQPILIWGDFDVDGQTATALLIDALQALGANVAFYIPQRLRESHGIRLDSLRTQLANSQPAILLTCDTGISAHEAIDYAKSQGVTVLITDHHDLPPALPAAQAVVNPKRLSPEHPLASLPGVGVAYKVVEELFSRFDRTNDLSQFLDLVALGIVADVATQTRDTRYLLQIGLDRLKNTTRAGLRVLMETAGMDQYQLSATDIGFQIGPRLNAAGRLDDARLGVRLLTTSSATEAQMLALQLDGLNNQRRLLQRQIYAAAQEQIARDSSLLNWEALIMAQPAWHAGILGIVAGQLAAQYQRPVALLTVSEDGIARGSARSVSGYDLGASLAAQADLLFEYGGHPGAAGFSLPVDNIPALRRRLSDTLRTTRDTSVSPGPELDAWVSLPDITHDLARALERLAPFGEGNLRPTLAVQDVTVRSAAYLDRARQHRRLTITDSSGARQSVYWWNGGDQPVPEGAFDLAFQLEWSTYQGVTELQLVLVDVRRSPQSAIEAVSEGPYIDDFRSTRDAPQRLKELIKEHPGSTVWAEGYRRAASPGVPLSELAPAPALIVYTAPHGPQALYEALQRVNPRRVVLLAIDPPFQDASAILRRLLELVKAVINQQAGRTTLTALAEALAQSPQSVIAALAFAEARGEIAVEYVDDDSLCILRAKANPSADQDDRFASFRAHVAEVAAYRAYFRRVDPHHLFGEPAHP